MLFFVCLIGDTMKISVR